MRLRASSALAILDQWRLSARMQKGEWSHLALPGAEFCCRVTPRARRNGITRDGDVIKISTTTAPEDGKATAAVTETLAHALGVAKTRLTLVRGATSRDKVFRLD